MSTWHQEMTFYKTSALISPGQIVLNKLLGDPLDLKFSSHIFQNLSFSDVSLWTGLNTGLWGPVQNEYGVPFVQLLRISRWCHHINQVWDTCACIYCIAIEASPESGAFGGMGQNMDWGESILFFFLRIPQHFMFTTTHHPFNILGTHSSRTQEFRLSQVVS